MFRNTITSAIADFLTKIGITVGPAVITEDTVLPGVQISQGKILVDEEKLTYPGDILHEAGHLAVVTAETRPILFDNIGRGLSNSERMGEEVAAIAWSYAAALHLQLPPEIVFHEGGYQGSSKAFIENFSQGRYVGVPLLQLYGLSYEAKQAQEQGVAPFPHMIKWLRE